jgi:hypothetical protein
MKLNSIFTFFILLVASCSKVSDSAEFQDCVKKGETYYKEIGSYPRLSTGESADELIKQKCYNTTGAFDGI